MILQFRYIEIVLKILFVHLEKIFKKDWLQNVQDSHLSQVSSLERDKVCGVFKSLKKFMRIFRNG